MFGDLPPEQQRLLMEDLEQHGQRQPIEILPDGTIIKGHQRHLAAQQLGWTTIDVIVRYDLADAADDVVEAELIGDNLFRRQMSPLARARAIKRMIEIKHGVRKDGLDLLSLGQLKQEIAEQLQMSKRNVNRHLNVLATPTSVQNAYDRGELTLVTTEKIAMLPKHNQEELAKRLKKGEKAKTLVTEYLTKPDPRHKKVGDAVASFARGLATAHHDLDGRVDKVSKFFVMSVLDELLNAQAMIEQLLAKRNDPDPPSLGELFRGLRLDDSVSGEDEDIVSEPASEVITQSKTTPSRRKDRRK